jgi:hypothetical protein
VYATPLKTPTATIGALNLFSREPMHLQTTDLKIARALAEVGPVAICTAKP